MEIIVPVREASIFHVIIQSKREFEDHSGGFAAATASKSFMQDRQCVVAANSNRECRWLISLHRALLSPVGTVVKYGAT